MTDTIVKCLTLIVTARASDPLPPLRIKHCSTHGTEEGPSVLICCHLASITITEPSVSAATVDVGIADNASNPSWK